MSRQNKQNGQNQLNMFKELTRHVVTYYVDNSWATKDTFLSMKSHPDIVEKIRLLDHITQKNDSREQSDIKLLLDYGLDADSIMGVITRINGLRELNQHLQNAIRLYLNTRIIMKHYITQFDASEESFHELLIQATPQRHEKFEFLRTLARKNSHLSGDCSKLELLLSRGHNIHSIIHTLAQAGGIEQVDKMLEDINNESCPDSPSQLLFATQTLWSKPQSPAATLTAEMLESPKANTSTW